MSTQTFTYNRGRKDLSQGNINWGAGTTSIQAILVSTAYTPDKDHDWISDVSAFEPYTSTRRVALVLTTGTLDDTNDRVVLDAQDSTFASLSGSTKIGGVVVARKTTSDGTSPLLSFHGMGSTAYTPTGVTLIVQWSTLGVVYETT